ALPALVIATQRARVVYLPAPAPLPTTVQPASVAVTAPAQASPAASPPAPQSSSSASSRPESSRPESSRRTAKAHLRVKTPPRSPALPLPLPTIRDCGGKDPLCGTDL